MQTDEFGNDEHAIRMVAIAAHARGDYEAERLALDRLALMERADSNPTERIAMADKKTRVTTVRLPEDLAADAEMVARIDGLPMSRLIDAAIAEHIKQRRADPEFRKRLKERIEADQKLLARLT